ncbi:M16 family metallopeptidase [Chryseosolibacter indicus]|uniref:Insulinase family protein n=1 Tax=Chryseosolibacter indicus TaxID=2782351 RepID=A0ABS5VV22_9BACT|nr:M16 family metallopeptidase [Chryseosolibacter indicus]MBT1704714.1 insulinase family protein [Chryseosolibacter indicus]
MIDKTLRILLVLVLLFTIGCKDEVQYEVKQGESNGYSYEYVTNDPLKVRIYTLKNGLKVYLSKYEGEPRIQTQIAVKAGGKNDPATNTGLAHYLEHIMFKGTADFGTLDWKKEEVLLDSIENMFTTYGALTDSVTRVNYYKLIDKVSNEASKYAIANEYDKMVSEIGAKGTNAYTTEDRTVYINDIPSNQLENWLQIEANRFQKIVPRLFHTELEAVYEEKNRSLDNDYWKTYEALYAGMFPKHQYGTQTVIGTIEHLKNPSITEIKNYFTKYYRPNNVAICLSGDMDYDKTIASIDKYFSTWQPNGEITPLERIEEEPLKQPVVKEVYGPDAEWINIGFRFKGRSSDDFQLLRLTDMILANSQAGLIDINLKQKQAVIEPSSYVDYLNDYAIHTFSGRPREGQSLDDVKKLLLEQIELLKKGEFEDWLIEATINDLKKSKIKDSEENWSRSNDLVIAFTNGIPWNKYIGEIEALRKFKKEDIVKFANENYKDNYVIVYKRTGKDLNAKKVNKPSITKVVLNKENKSPFHERIGKNKVEKLKPVFLDYDKDIKKLSMNKGVEVLYTPNQENELYSLYYLSDVGTNNDPRMNIAIEYLQYVGTDDMSAEDVKKEFYKLGSNFDVFAAEDQTYIYLEGLSETMDKSLALFEKLLANAKADDEALKKMVDGIFKKREDAKKSKSTIMFSGLMNYGLYGAKSPFTNVLSNKELRELKSEELTSIIKDFTKTEHRVLYYGPKKEQELLATVNQYHVLPDKLKPTPEPVKFDMADAKEPSVYWTDYDMVQEEIMFLTKSEEFDKNRIAISRMFNEYFGGNMSSPVFQELRESQGLAYSAFAYYGTAAKPTKNDFFYAYMGTQADKQPEAMKAMLGLLQSFPKSDNGFEVARNSILNQIESERITKAGILFNYESARKKGLSYDIRKDVYDQVQRFTLADVEKFQGEYLKNKNFNVVLIGNKDKINFQELKRYGKIQELSLDELFGYEKVQKINLEKVNQ